MINQVVLVGRLTKDADLRYTSGGQAVATFNLAVNRNFTNQSGEREADFVNCVIWRKPAETLANYAKKGTLIGVVGRIQTRNYENQQGQRVFVVEVVCDNFQLLESRNVNEQRQNTENFSNQNSQSQLFDSRKPNDIPNFDKSTDPFGQSNQIDISDDDLPF